MTVQGRSVIAKLPLDTSDLRKRRVPLYSTRNISLFEVITCRCWGWGRTWRRSTSSRRPPYSGLYRHCPSTGVKRKVFVNRYTLRQHNLENFILLGNKLSYLLVYFNLILHLRKLWLNCGFKNNSLTLCMQPEEEAPGRHRGNVGTDWSAQQTQTKVSLTWSLGPPRSQF